MSALLCLLVGFLAGQGAAMIQVRGGYTHNGRSGWLVCGRNVNGQRVRIFVDNGAALYHIRNKAKKGEPIETVDFHWGKRPWGAEAALVDPFTRTTLPYPERYK